MRIGVVGGGPSGLYFAYLMKRLDPTTEITIVEQNPKSATYGFGVVFSDKALTYLKAGDPRSFEVLSEAMETWPDLTIVQKDERVPIDGNGFSAIARLRLLNLLQDLCGEAGVEIVYETHLSALDRFAGCDLVVGADGVNSTVREAHADVFRPDVSHLTNRFAWYGTSKVFDTLTLTFRTNPDGAFVAHHYRYSPTMSTFIVECDAATWQRAGFGRMTDEESRAYCERVFAPDLDGHPLVSNKSIWRTFPVVTCRRWHHGKTVLIGDALRTVHFSIGSGTRLALEDAIALRDAFASAGPDVPAALARFEAERRPVVEKLLGAAANSFGWYEAFASKMHLDAPALAYDYMTRSGRVDDDRLRTVAPRFMAVYERWRDSVANRPQDLVPRDAPGTKEIGFAVLERYNASHILFDNLAAGRAGKAAIHCEGETVTYGALCDLASRAGSGLRDLGLRRSERVLVLLHDRPAYAAAVFGAIRAGFVPVLVNTLTPAEDVAYFLEDSGARVAIVEPDLAAKLAAGPARLERAIVVGDGALPDLPFPTTRWDDFVAAASPDLAEADTHRDDMAFWMYSSGSTGRPKGVVHLQHDPLYTARSYAAGVLGIREDDVVFSVPKIFFAYGFGNSLTFPFSVGASAVLMPGRPEPGAICDRIERCRPTMLFALPTLYKALLAHPGSEGRDLTSLRLCISAAEPLSPGMFNEWRRRYGLEIIEGLGSTEVLHIYLSNRPGAIKPGSSGLRVPGYEIRLVDEEDREVAGSGTGVLWVRGDSSAPCYWNRPDKTAETMRQGWIYTGDRFERDADGFYTFAGRADDLIKVSGQWVHPVEVETCLARHPAVHECVVMGLADENRLTTLTAFVSLRPGHAPDDATAADLQAFVKRELLPYKYPRRVVFLDELPKTGTGKIDRRALRTET